MACEGTSKTGYRIIEIPLLDPSSVDAVMTKRVVQEYGLKPTTSLGLSFDADVSSQVRRALDATPGPASMSDVFEKNAVTFPSPRRVLRTSTSTR